MIKIKVEKYIEIGEQIEYLKVGLDDLNGVKEDYVEIDSKLGELLYDMMEIAETLGARNTMKMLDRRIENFDAEQPKTYEELGILVEMLKGEFVDQVFLHIPASDARYYQKHDYLTTDTAAAFPCLAQELHHAGNAYACGMPTAAMYHCMRALEYGLGAIAVDLGLTWTKENWQVILNQIEKKIRDLGVSLPRGPEKDQRLNELSAAAKEFFYFKDGWRNYVAHNRITYDPGQAAEMIEHVRSLTEHLAARMNLSEAT